MNRAALEARYKRQNEAIRFMHSEGKTLSGISAALGMSKEAVRGRAKRMGLTFADWQQYVPAERHDDDTLRLLQIEDDARFQALLQNAWDRGEFPGQTFRLVAE